MSEHKSPCRVLVVEDNKDGADTMAMLLSLNGHDVRVAYDGKSAIDTAHEFKPQVVLLDIALPRVNGYDVAREMREHTWGERPFLVAITGLVREEDKQRASAAGFDYHLCKPADPKALEELVSAACRHLSAA